MTLGTALFASILTSTVLVLAVYHKPFRKVFFWVTGSSAIAAGIFFLSLRLYHRHVTKQQDGERMSAFAIASACERNPDFTPVANSSYLANLVEVHGGATLKITPQQRFSPEGDPDVIPIIYLGHHQTFVLSCGNYGDTPTNISINQGLVSCPDASAVHECKQWDDKADKWAKYLALSLGDCTRNGCVVLHGKRIVGGISRNEITNAQWDICDNEGAK
ncbi:MAG: hypothetical protein DMG40_22700 [Acidobacteria bacterium]|nr:MAG: hypothetical protein DMG40_22700 [Acidobacteriota bacterium]